MLDEMTAFFPTTCTTYAYCYFRKSWRPVASVIHNAKILYSLVERSPLILNKCSDGTLIVYLHVTPCAYASVHQQKRESFKGSNTHTHTRCSQAMIIYNFKMSRNPHRVLQQQQQQQLDARIHVDNNNYSLKLCTQAPPHHHTATQHSGKKKVYSYR